MMKENDTPLGSYVDRIREDTGRYVRQLLQEHEDLRLRFAQLEDENARMREEASKLRQDLDTRRKEEEALQERLLPIREESPDYMRRFSRLQPSNSNPPTPYAPTYHLHPPPHH